MRQEATEYRVWKSIPDDAGLPAQILGTPCGWKHVERNIPTAKEALLRARALRRPQSGLRAQNG